MVLPHQLSRVRSVVLCSAALFTLCGCADMLPSAETWDKWSPSNMWYRMQPNQLGRLNEGSGLSADPYYSISDYPERESATLIKPTESAPVRSER